MYCARRYRVTRTIWRGIRFWMTGSGWSYAWRSLLWGTLLVPSLGFAYPWRMAALERYKLGNTHYGTLPGRFTATGWQLFKRVWWVWLLGLAPVLVVLLGSVVATIAEQRGGMRGGMPLIVSGLAIIVGTALFAALPFLHAVRKATEWRWWAEGIRFGEVTVTCSLPRSGLIGIYWALIGMSLPALFAFGVLGTVIAGVVLLDVGRAGTLAGKLAQAPLWGFIASVIWYLALFLTFGVLVRIYTLQRVWRRVVNACILVNPIGAADVAAAGEAASAFGEGLADGLDFAGF